MPTASGHTKAIRASRVIGSDVYISNGDKFGHIEDVVLDKTADRIMFAVIARDGALTAVANFYPVPWSELDYVEGKDGYVLPYGEEKFEQAETVSSITELIRNDGERAA